MSNYVLNWIPGVQKAFEALCFITRNSEHRMDAIRASAVLFLADAKHLTTYGRPIYGEHWSTAWYGAEPKVASQIINRDEFALAMLEDAAVLGEKGLGDFFFCGLRQPNPNKLSESDVECLTEALRALEDHSHNEIIGTIRRHQAVISTSGSIPIRNFFIGDPDGEARVRELEEVALYAVF